MKFHPIIALLLGVTDALAQKPVITFDAKAVSSNVSSICTPTTSQTNS